MKIRKDFNFNKGYHENIFKILSCILLFNPIPNFAQEQNPSIIKRSSSWESVHYSLGVGMYSGLGYSTDNNFLALGNLNMRFFFNKNFEISFHHILLSNYTLFPYKWNKGNLHSFNPLYISLGYGKKIQDMHWFIDGGGGITSPGMPQDIRSVCGVDNPDCFIQANDGQYRPVISISTGIEWLALQNYALGLMLTGIATLKEPAPDFAIIFSLTANIVL